MPLEIISEIAQGYQGSRELARLLVKGAIKAGADAIKIQMILADEICTKDYPYYEFFRSLEMDSSVWRELINNIKNNNKKIYLDVFGMESIALAREYGVDGVKITATDFHNSKLRELACEQFDTVIISIGGATIDEIKDILDSASDIRNLVLMLGFQAEPTEIEDNNLNRIKRLKILYPDLRVGFMDHTKGDLEEAFYLPAMAMAAGADVIEKHITLDYSLQIEDYISALSIDKFELFVERMKRLEVAMGGDKFDPTPKEKGYKSRASKVAVASRNIKPLEKIDENDVILKRVSIPINKDHFLSIDELVGKAFSDRVYLDKPFMRSKMV